MFILEFVKIVEIYGNLYYCEIIKLLILLYVVYIMVKICPECQKENVDTNKFCEYCGSNLPLEEEKNISKSVKDNTKDVIKQNVEAIKDKVDSTVVEEKLAFNEKKIKRQEKELAEKKELISKHNISENKIEDNEKKIKKQQDEIAKNQELIDKQNKNISKNKTVNDGEFHKLKYKLFYWNNKEINEYVFSKTKFISVLIFVLFFAWAALSAPVHGILSILFGSILIGLIFAVPSFIIGYIIHYLMNRK